MTEQKKGGAGVRGLNDRGPDPQPLPDAVDRRLADVLPKPEANRLRMALDTPALVAGVRVRVKGLLQEYRGVTGSALRGALAARQIEGDAKQRNGSPAA